jgi:RNA polymerase sigma factor (sigma-70 family)
MIGSKSRPLNDDERRIVEDNIRLVHHVVYRQMRLEGDVAEESVAAGMLGLMRAAQKFDPDRGIRFSTYACIWIRSAIQRDRQAFMGRSYRGYEDGREGYEQWHTPVSLDAPIGEDGFTLGAVLAGDSDPASEVLSEIVSDELVAEALRRCDHPLDVAIIAGRAEGRTFAEIARENDVSGEWVRRRTQAIRRRMRSDLVAA